MYAGVSFIFRMMWFVARLMTASSTPPKIPSYFRYTSGSDSSAVHVWYERKKLRKYEDAETRSTIPMSKLSQIVRAPIDDVLYGST